MRDLIASLSSRFINASPEEIEALIQYSLSETGKRLKVDRCFLLVYSGNQRNFEKVEEWHRQGLNSIFESVQQLSRNPQGWSLSRLKQGEVLEINRLEDLPEQATFERELYQRSNSAGLLIVPMVLNNAVIGLLGLVIHQNHAGESETGEARHWAPNELIWLHSLAEMLTNVLARRRAQYLQDATYKIAQASFAAQNLEDLYVKIHEILRGLMPVDNFFLALYNQEKDILEFPYYVDQYDPKPNAQHPGHGLTEYVLRTGKPLWAPDPVFKELIASGEINLIGEPCLDWVGVPLIVKERTIGVMASQSYTKGVQFSEYELDILNFVSTLVAMVIERKLAEQQLQTALNDKEVLLREVHRRVRNNMQVVSSMIGLQAEEILDERYKTVFEQLQGRIRAMAMVHEELYRSENFRNIQFDEYVENLTQTVQLAYCTSPKIHVHVDVEPIEFDLETAIPCGLILHELLTAAMEHTFPPKEPGEIWVGMHLQGDQCVLNVCDNGAAKTSQQGQSDSHSFGFQLVEILSNQLHAVLSTVMGSTVKPGTQVELVFPAPRPRPAGLKESSSVQNQSEAAEVPGLDKPAGRAGTSLTKKNRLFDSDRWPFRPGEKIEP